MKMHTICLILFVGGLQLCACGEAASTNGPLGQTTHEIPVSDGKADNYVSTNAREFELLGTAHTGLPTGYASMSVEEQESAVTDAVEKRLTVVSRSVERHLDEVIDSVNDEIDDEQAEYFIYARRQNGETLATRVLDDGRVQFDFELEVIGSVYLMSKVAPDTSGSTRTFEVEVKDWSETDGELVEVEIRGSDSRDAFPKYDELFADGVYDIAVHFGGDYNEERFDLETARWLFDYLKSDGWTIEGVETFDDLTIDSPPFRLPMTVEGEPVEARLYLYHSDMVEPADEMRLTEAMEHSFAQRDVVIYSGHAGEGAGFILDYQPRHEIRAGDFKELPLADKYQIYVFDGCQTYRTYVNDLMENPNKTFDNVDIVTTVNTTPFSVGYQVLYEMIYWITLTDQAGQHLPLTWKAILRGINTEDYRDVHYGVHGIDNDPGLNPHASEGLVCTACSTDADCGAGGNLCLGYSNSSACGVACATDTACPDGYRCARLYDDPDLFYIPKQCVKRDLACE